MKEHGYDPDLPRVCGLTQKVVLCNGLLRPEVVSEQDGSQRLKGGLEQRLLAIWKV